MSPVKRHLVALAGIIFVGLPILTLDLLLLGPTGSGWAALDLRGFLIGSYGIVAALYWILSGVVAFAIRPRTLGCLGYAAVAAAVVGLVAAIGGAYYAIDGLALERETAAEEEAMLAETVEIGEDVELVGWSISDGEVVLSVRSGRARALCSWSVTGDFDDYVGAVQAQDDIDEYTCGTPGPHRTLPEGLSELRRPYALERRGTPDAVTEWRVELGMETPTGGTRLIWRTGATEQIYPGEYTRPLPVASPH